MWFIAKLRFVRVGNRSISRFTASVGQGLVVVSTAAMPLLIGPLAWLILRALVGFGCAGLFITTESWLNAKARPTERGRVFSIYMVGTFLALALGQLLIGPADIETPAPFNAIVALFAVALVMVSTTRAEPPELSAATTPPYGQLARTAPIAVGGSALSGLISSSFYALVPAWMQGEGIARETISICITGALRGGQPNDFVVHGIGCDRISLRRHPG
jgi:MFS family permease